MRRRAFITLLGGAGAWSLAARAQQSALPVVGYLDLLGPQSGATALQLFQRALAEVGYVEGRDISMEYRWAEGRRDQLPGLVADLVRRRVAVIVTPSDPTIALAAKAATATIPIVFTSGNDPVRAGLVTNYNRPGGNITGVTYFVDEMAPKRLELLRELVRHDSPIATLAGPPIAGYPATAVEALRAAARRIGQELLLFEAGTPIEIDEAFANMARQHVSGVILNGSRLVTSQAPEVISLAAHYRIPAIYYTRSFVDAGGLMSYSDDRYQSWRQAASYVARILKGEKPGDLPVVQPTKFELVINLKTGNALGLTIPPLLRAFATEVIE
jgi:putative ABC transport system substrate-binding protein